MTIMMIMRSALPLVAFVAKSGAAEKPAALLDNIARPPLPFGAECTPKLLGSNSNAQGHDLAHTGEPQSSDDCVRACCDNPKCGGVLWQPVAQQTWSACIAGRPCCFLKTQVADAAPWPTPFPNGSYVYEMTGRPQDDEKLHFLSATLGSHMVLQQAPTAAMIWGFTHPGARVSTTMAPSDAAACRATPRLASASAKLCAVQILETVATADGTWRQTLPPMPASKAAFDFHIVARNGSSQIDEASMADVLFGEVYICGGQSNMEFAMPAVANASAERHAANGFPTVRIFSVGHATASPTALRDLQTVWEPWQVVSNVTIGEDYTSSSHLFATFSAVCWFFGRTLSASLSPTGDVPVGLVSNNWGGSKLEQWAPAATFDDDCHAAVAYPHDGPMYNAMIRPYAVGPMAVAGFAWYQGEADTASAEQYACTFPSMIRRWRSLFGQPLAFFGFVQLSTWCAWPPESVPRMREAQMSALALPRVGYATNADHGMGCNIHPAAKQYAGERLAASALALQYGRKKTPWRSPTYKGAVQLVAAPEAPTVARLRVRLSDVSEAGLRTQWPANYAPPGYMDRPPEPLVNCSGTFAVNRTHNASMLTQCAWAGLLVDGIGWLNATVDVADDGRDLILSAEIAPQVLAPGPIGARGAPVVLGSAYAWGPIPMMSAYDRGTALPVLAWNETLTLPASRSLPKV